jgi:hypothetical protein
MPTSLFVVAWDEFEGAIITNIVPEGYEIGPNEVQTIDVAHQFNQGSNWIIVEDKGFKAVSVFDDKLQKSIALTLKEHEIPNNYVNTLDQLAKYLLVHAGTPDFQALLADAFEKVQAEISANEIMLLTFAKRIEELEVEKLEMKERASSILKSCADLINEKIMLYLLIHEPVTDSELVEGLVAICHDETEIRAGFDWLVQEKCILPADNGTFILNPDLDPGSH